MSTEQTDKSKKKPNKNNKLIFLSRKISFPIPNKIKNRKKHKNKSKNTKTCGLIYFCNNGSDQEIRKSVCWINVLFNSGLRCTNLCNTAKAASMTIQNILQSMTKQLLSPIQKTKSKTKETNQKTTSKGVHSGECSFLERSKRKT